MDERETKVVGAVFGVGLLVAGALLLMGGQTSTILSKVGASIGSSGDQVSGGEAAPQDQPEAGPAGGASPADLAADVRPLTLLIVRKGSLTLEADDIGSTLTAAAGIVTASGGFVAASTESGSGGEGTATADYRIPAAAWDATLGRLRGLAIVRGQQVSTEEVTGQVVDLGARIGNLRATEAALQTIMARATRISDVLDVQKQLTDTRGQIEQLTAQKADLVDRAAFGSLTVTFRPPVAPAPRATSRPGWDPARDADAAGAKLVRIGQKATTVGIWVAIVGLPILVALAIAAGLAWLAYRLVSRPRGRREPAVA